MDERQEAWHTANRWLDQRMNALVDMVPGDPDCAANVLARQYMRALDKINQLHELAARLHAGQSVTQNMVEAALGDRWPKSIQP